METKVQKIIAKIQQLRAIAGSTHSRAEAETCLGLVTKFITEFQIAEADIQSQLGPNEDPIDLDSESIIYESGRKNVWKAELAIGLADLNGLFLYNAQVRGGKAHRLINRYRIIGRKSDVELALYMMAYLVSEIGRLADSHFTVGQFGVDEDGRLVGKRGVNPQKESWCLGCVRGFITKMKAEKAEVMKQASSTALVFIGNKSKEAEEAWQSKTKTKLVKSTYRSKAQVDADNYRSGYVEGQKLSVSAGLGTNQSESKKLKG